jgi:hypothetical protein
MVMDAVPSLASSEFVNFLWKYSAIAMKEYVIDVARIEELQMLSDTHELENIFTRAKSTIVNGEKVILVRKSGATPAQKFDELTTLRDLEQYKKTVFKYL